MCLHPLGRLENLFTLLRQKGFYEHQQDSHQQAVQTCGLCHCLAKEHGLHDLGLRAGIASHCRRSVSCRDTLTNTRSDTGDNRQTCANCGTS